MDINGSVDPMETLLLNESVKQYMGRKRPKDFTCHRARSVDWFVCERSRVMSGTARINLIEILLLRTTRALILCSLILYDHRILV